MRCAPRLENGVSMLKKKGAGEILLVSVDKDGTGTGIDLDLRILVCESVNIPIVINGGVGNILDIKEIIKNENISGIAISSILHYYVVFNQNTFNKNSPEGNMNFLQNENDSCLI